MASTLKRTSVLSWMTLIIRDVNVEPVTPRKAMYPVRAAKNAEKMIIDVTDIVPPVSWPYT